MAEGWGSGEQVVSYHASDPSIADQILNELKPGSLVVNATGLGKDIPGSPITNSALFPEKGIAWDFNYRGDLKFLTQARSQKQTRKITLVDGWDYFVIGWSQVIADIFNIEIPTSGILYEALSKQAKKNR